MTSRGRFQALVLLALCGRWCSGSGIVQIKNNGYEGVIVAISPNVDEDQAIIRGIETLFTGASSFLYRATRNRAFFSDIKILIPSNWTKTRVDKHTDDLYEDSHFRIENEDIVPYTQQTRGCGEEGDFVQMSKTFLMDLSGKTTVDYGNPAKVIVHEWAHLRYGVFDEHGVPGDSKYPFMYRKGSGEVGVNSCSTKTLNGTTWDHTTGDDCKVDSTGLPDNNCLFYPNPDNDVHTSLMSFSFIESVDTFCDDTPANMHQWEAPNKHNLLCNYRSTWDVISSHQDFARGNNRPANIQNVRPIFTVVQADTARFVLVADISSSMNDDQKIDRLYRAARRWIKYELPDGVSLGIVQFSTSARIVSPIIRVDSTSRELLMNMVPHTAEGNTCIGCALELAKSMLKNGGVILLISDGMENEAPYMDDITPSYVGTGVRVVSVAFTDQADPKIERLAELTNGKSYFVRDYQELSQALIGSETFQPAGLQQEKELSLYEKQFTGIGSQYGTFAVDDTTGRDFVFQVDYSERAYIGSLRLYSPAGRTYSEADVHWDTDGHVGQINEPLAQVGPWRFTLGLNQRGDKNFAVVTVKTKAREHTTEPIYTKCWISSGSSADPRSKKVVIFGEVKQGNKPVIGAHVQALVTRPEEAPVTIKLLDNGAGADITRNDGIYSRYFTAFTKKGRYGVQCQVWNEGTATLDIGFHGSKVLPRRPELINQMTSGDNGSNSSQELGVFTRHATAGSFQITEDIDTDQDTMPPSRITDLDVRMVSVKERFQYNLNGESIQQTLMLSWTSTGDDYDEGRADTLVLKMSTNISQLRYYFHNPSPELVEITDNSLWEGSLSPMEGGTVHAVTLNPDVLNISVNTEYYFALKAYDETRQESPLSNIPRGWIQWQKELPESKSFSSLHYVIIIVAAVCLLLMIAIILLFYMIRNKQQSDSLTVLQYKPNKV